MKQSVRNFFGFGTITWGVRLLLLVVWLLSPVAFLLAWIKLGVCTIGGSTHGLPVSRALDRMGNAAIGGDENETISSRASRLQDTTGWACGLCKILDKVQKDHCKDSIGV